MSTNSVCSAHVAEDDVNAQVTDDMFLYPVASGGMTSCILSDIVFSTHVAKDDMTAVYIQTH